MAGAADPGGLPRQRRGITPQLHGRYPDYDVLEQAEHWDEATRATILDRVENVPAVHFFTEKEAETLTAFCDVVLAQDADPRIPVLNYIDEKYSTGSLDGYQYADMPDDREVWKLVAEGLEATARERGAESFALATFELQHRICDDFAHSRLRGGVWERLNTARAWSLVMRGCVDSFYSHPWAWNEIGFGGPAYPRGYSRFGSPHLDAAEREEWEGEEVVSVDPVRDVRERVLES